MAKQNIRIVKDEEAPETVELLAKSIVQVSKASQKILDAGLTSNGLITLLHRQIGAQNISRLQIELVLENLSKLKSWYVKK